MKWIQIGAQKQEGLNRRTYAANIEGIGCMILVNSDKFENMAFVPGIQLEGEKLVPLPPPQEILSIPTNPATS